MNIEGIKTDLFGVDVRRPPSREIEQSTTDFRQTRQGNGQEKRTIWDSLACFQLGCQPAYVSGILQPVHDRG